MKTRIFYISIKKIIKREEKDLLLSAPSDKYTFLNLKNQKFFKLNFKKIYKEKKIKKF